MSIAPLTTTGIGSLPHREIGEALDQAFRMDIPYLPQLPMRDAREFMLPHALEGMPGIRHDPQGMIVLELEAWKKGALAYDDKLVAAIEGDELAPFEPSPEYAAAFRPFLERVTKSGAKRAKVQIAGPMTLQWSLRTSDGAFLPATALTHVSRTVLARTLAMARAVKEAGASPVVFVDEPGLYAFSRSQPNHIMMLQELRINVMALKKRGAEVGLHCCSNADWGAIMGLGLDVLAVDARLSLPTLLKSGEALVTFVVMGGRLALGVIPTDTGERPSVEVLIEEMEHKLGLLEEYFPTRASVIENILAKSLLTPACGLGLLSEARAESVVQDLAAYRDAFEHMRQRQR